MLFSGKQYKKYGGILYASNYAIRLEKVAGSYFGMDSYEDAIDWYLKAADVLHTLIKNERYKDYEALSRCYEQTGRAALCCDTNSYNETAESMFEIVIDIRLKMKNKFPEVFIDNDLAISYYNLALAQYELEKYDMAFKHFKMASDLEYAPAINYLGIAFEFGEGTEIDIEKTKEYYKKAFDQGDVNGKTNLERLKTEGTGSLSVFKNGVMWYNTNRY